MDTLTLLRQYKIGPFAIFDTVISFVGMYLFAPFLSKLFLKIHVVVPRSSWLWFMFPVSVLVHFIFRQQTPLMKMLYPPDTNIVAIFILVIMITMGMRNIRFMHASGVGRR